MQDLANIDVTVVGAGPSGSSAAYILAQSGLKVLLLDKEDFPRDKPCGGGLTTKTINLLHGDLTHVIERRCNEIEISRNLQHSLSLPHTGIFCCMVQRPFLDTLLRDKAVEAGAIFQKIEGISSIINQCNKVDIVLTNGTKVTSQWVIAADGAKSVIRRLLHPRKVVSQAFALEGKAPLNGTNKVSFDFFVLPWGYGWVFPKGDHLNVGIITFNRAVKISRKMLLDYCRRKLGHSKLSDVVGYPLGIGPHSGKQALGRVLFVGDAAGNVEPLLGEGIHNAVFSGQRAAQAIISGGSPFKVRWRYRLLMNVQRRDLATSHNLAYLFYGLPTLGWWFLSKRWVSSKLINGFAQGKRLEKIVRS